MEENLCLGVRLLPGLALLFLIRYRALWTAPYCWPKIYLLQGKRPQAEALLRQVLQVENLPPQDRARVAAILPKLTPSEPQKPIRPIPGKNEVV